jgi:hypothetical protein
VQRTATVLACSLAFAIVSPAPSRAGTLESTDDPGSITEIGSGVSELGLGALALLTYHDEGDTSNTRVNMLLGLGYQYVIRDNLSLGGQLLLNRDRTSDATSSLAVGGAVLGTYHVRLGFNAFLRPTLACGVLFGDHERATDDRNLVMETNQTAFLIRLQLPLAYYASQHIVLQAGPELDLSLGSVDQPSRGAKSFTTLASGFSVGLGYVF